MRPMFIVRVSKCISPTALLFAGTLAACNTEESAGQPQTDTTVEADAATDGSTQDVAIDAFAVLVKAQTFPAKPQQITAGIDSTIARRTANAQVIRAAATWRF